ncbi:MAG: DUF1345 domain-containing protein [Betaproteobacteria bacterium]|nr:DUF1345 domain-containing protein [Betaproteobacteria bacterium]
MKAAIPTSGVLARWWRRLRARPNLSIAALLLLGLSLALTRVVSPSRALLLAFNAASLYYLVAMTAVMFRATPATMRQRSRSVEQGKWAVPVASIIVAAVALVALYAELHAGKTKSVDDAALAGSTLLLSWLFLAVVFTQQYAHAYYVTPEGEGGGLVFPGTPTPDYWDFLYFSIVLSMTFQVSDVQICSRRIRHQALLHGLVGFFYNVIIIAITVNVVAGIL